MQHRRTWVSWMVRGGAGGLSGIALTMLLFRGPDQYARAEVRPAPRPQTVVSASTAAQRTRQWVVTTDGWRIRFATAIPDPRRQAPQPPPPSTFSPYDHLIVRHAEAEGFDWRLVAALIAEESGFNPTIQSERGAYGLMQIMPIAAEAVGAAHFAAPDDNLAAGVRYLRHLSGMFDAASGADQLKLVLAAYNMGPGHVQDAQTLARALGQDPNRWDGEMDAVLPLLEDPDYYQLLPSGYAQGSHTVRYVEHVIARYDRYTRIVGRRPGLKPESQVASGKPQTKRRRRG